MSRKKKKSEAIVYCGPTMKDVKQYDLFYGGVPKYLEKYSTDKLYKNFFIPVSQLARFREKLKEKGSMENKLFYKALKEGGKK